MESNGIEPWQPAAIMYEDRVPARGVGAVASLQG